MKLRYKIILLYLIMLGIALLMKGCEAEEVNVDIVIQIESGGNPNAYNKKTGAIGLCQITPICYKDYHERSMRALRKINPGDIIGYWKPEDLWDATINRNIGSTYINTHIPQMLKAYGISDTIDNRLIAYNWGIGNLKKWYQSSQNFNKLPKETRNYLWRYHKLVKEK